MSLLCSEIAMTSVGVAAVGGTTPFPGWNQKYQDDFQCIQPKVRKRQVNFRYYSCNPESVKWSSDNYKSNSDRSIWVSDSSNKFHMAANAIQKNTHEFQTELMPFLIMSGYKILTLACKNIATTSSYAATFTSSMLSTLWKVHEHTFFQLGVT